MQGTEPLCVALHPGQPASGSSAVTGDRAQPVIGQANGLVALTVGCLALGTYIRRDLTGGAGIALSIGAVICVIGLNSASASGREQLATTPLSGLGPPLGLAVGPIIPRLRERGPRCAVRGAEATGAFDPAREPDGCARRTRDLRRTHGPHFRRCWRVVQRWIPRRH